MEYISADEFLKQPVEVQKVFIDWWKPSIGDLYAYEEKDFKEYAEVECITSKNVIRLVVKNKNDKIPLLSEGQLRQFIEDKTGCIINVSYKHKPKDGYMELEFDFYEYPSKDKYMVYISTEDIIASSILEAWWKVALEIAKEG